MKQLIKMATICLFFSCGDENISIVNTGSAELFFYEESRPVGLHEVRITSKQQYVTYYDIYEEESTIFEGYTTPEGSIRLGPVSEGLYNVRLFLMSGQVFTENIYIVPGESIVKQFDLSRYRSNAILTLENASEFTDSKFLSIQFHAVPYSVDRFNIRLEDLLTVSIKGERISDAIIYPDLFPGTYYPYVVFENIVYWIDDPTYWFTIHRDFELEKEVYLPSEILLHHTAWEVAETLTFPGLVTVPNVITEIWFDADKCSIRFENESVKTRGFHTDINYDGMIEIDLDSDYYILEPSVYRIYGFTLLPNGGIEVDYENYSYQDFVARLVKK